MTATPPITTLVFDAYGTLFDVFSVEAAAERSYPGSGAAIAQMWRQKQMEYMWLRSLMGKYEDFDQVTEASLRYTCRTLGLEVRPDAVAAMMDSYLHLSPWPEAASTLEQLRDYRRAILSNGTPDGLSALVANTGLINHFDELISVNDIQIYKPHPQVYALATRKLDVEPQRIGFVSSNFWDVSGAAAYGFRVFWINRKQAPADPLGYMADAVLDTLADLPAAVSAFNNLAAR